ncbi:hypothetical protein HZA55_06300 [Candidatus Poribacteria bacterium]|nr:hypothetical protein [Candidatus Poribacteria bacterium]
MKNSWLNYLSIGIVSLSIFIYEILLVRIFSVLFIYKILFLIISLAILGIGIGGLIFEWLFKKKPNEILPSALIWLGFSASFLVSLFILTKFFYIITLPGCIIISTIPFVLGGMILSSFYNAYTEKSSILYLADLLGGVTGCILSLALTYFIGIINAVIAASIISLIPFFILYKDKIIGSIVLVIFCVILFLNINQRILEINYNELKHADTPLGYALNYPRLPAEILKTRWDIYSRTDLVKLERKDRRRAIFINGGTQAIMLKYSDEDSAKKTFQTDVTGYPYKIEKCRDVLVLGSGGGRDVRIALLNGVNKITAVEINKTVVSMTKEESAYNGGIYNDPRVKVVIEDGRSFIMQDKSNYDRIVLSLATTHAFSDVNSIAQFENYLYTKEAIAEYFNHLKDTGMIAFFVDYEQIMKKFVISAIKYLEEQGVPQKEAVKHILVLTTASEWSAYSYILLVGKKSFGFNTTGKLIACAEDLNLQPVIFPYSLTDTDFDNIINGSITTQDYIERSPYNISPATDDNPYFMEVVINYREKLIAMIAILFVILIILCAAFIFIKNKTMLISASLQYILYFFSIGIGFMLVEIALIKRLSYYLGYPELNFVLILSSILIASGIGAYITNFFKEQQWETILKIASILIISIIITMFGLVPFINATIQLNIVTRSFLLFIFVFPVSFFMGMMLPAGLKLAKTRGETDIPWYWGVNGIASVIGSILAVVLSMSYGFTLAFAIAGIFYATAGLILKYRYK